MIPIYFGALVGCICAYAVAYPQFYYMVPAPAQPPSTYYSTSLGPNIPFTFGSPTASFVSRSFGPSQAYYTTHQTFGSLEGAAPSPIYQTFADPTSNGIVETQDLGFQQPASVPASIVFSDEPTGQYRGFAYHTQSTNGASANVFFLTGPEAHQLRNLQTFTSTVAQNDTSQKARTLASDTVDSNATDKNQQQQISETLSEPAQGPAFEAIRSFLENPQLGFQHFYSSNGQLFSRPAKDDPHLNLPANTVLLPSPVTIQAFGNLGLLSSRFGKAENVTKTNATTEKAQDKGAEGAESVIADVKIEPSANLAEDGSTTSAPNSTSALTTEVTTSTAPTSTEEAAKETPTIKEARSIKQESSTTKELSTTTKPEKGSEKLHGSSMDSITKMLSTTKKA